MVEAQALESSSILYSVPSRLCDLDTDLSEPQFPHLESRDNIIYLDCLM